MSASLRARLVNRWESMSKIQLSFCDRTSSTDIFNRFTPTSIPSQVLRPWLTFQDSPKYWTLFIGCSTFGLLTIGITSPEGCSTLNTSVMKQKEESKRVKHCKMWNNHLLHASLLTWTMILGPKPSTQNWVGHELSTHVLDHIWLTRPCCQKHQLRASKLSWAIR